MDRDAIALSGIIVSAVALFLSGNALWFVPLIACSIYGGWRLGQRIIPPEEHGV